MHYFLNNIREPKLRASARSSLMCYVTVTITITCCTVIYVTVER